MANNDNSSSFIKVAIGSIVAVAMVIVLIILITTLSVSGAITRLTSEGYIVLAAGEYESIVEMLEDISLELSHMSKIFPDLTSDIDLTCTFTSGAIDEFDTWAEITDSGATTLSSVFAFNAGHISALTIRNTSDDNLMYCIELG